MLLQGVAGLLSETTLVLKMEVVLALLEALLKGICPRRLDSVLE